MDNIKVTANFELPGSVMYNGEDSSHYTSQSNIIEHTVRKGKKLGIKREPIVYKVRKCIPAIQCINLTEESYEYMTSKEVPSFSKKSVWHRLSKNLRLTAHLEEIAGNLGGTLLNFTVYED